MKSNYFATKQVKGAVIIVVYMDFSHFWFLCNNSVCQVSEHTNSK